MFKKIKYIKLSQRIFFKKNEVEATTMLLDMLKCYKEYVENLNTKNKVEYKIDE